MIDRYKKKGGFFQLVQLIETTAKTKQEQFIQIILNENKVWGEAIVGKMLTTDRIITWSPETLAEIFSRIQTLTLAVFFQGRDQALIDRCLGAMSQAEKRKIFDLMDEKVATPAERAHCHNRVITEVREFIKSGILKLEKIDPDLMIPENIEELLNQRAENN
ncbi:MAG: FliG C-terminal domain-containing protein [Bdellovibrionota bacterium]